ncbi:MAG: alpha/beta hydrolase [Rhodospirillaceae bacterium]|nr:MAG: alpha/beta hydrolase [Rhodospirillaceae bacterium]
MATASIKSVKTGILQIAYEEAGPADGKPVIMMHGFPDDPRIWDGVVADLAGRGYRTLTPYLRGYGATKFLSDATPRSGQQAALGKDLLDFMIALAIDRASLVGYDWGGRACCIVAALWPERVDRLVSIGGYNIQNIPASHEPAPADIERRYWYQWYFNTERGRQGLTQNRREICRMLWEMWSPNWRFDDATFDRTAAAFDNPDFVEVVIHSYRHRFKAAAGDPELEAIEDQLARQPKIGVPSVVLHGACDGVDVPAGSEQAYRHFTGPYCRRVVPVAGHFLPREAAKDVVEAVIGPIV